MIVVDEYLILRAITNGEVPGLPEDEVLGLTYLRHWRLISKIALADGQGQLSRHLSGYSPSIHRMIEQPDPDLVRLIDPLRLSVKAARYLSVLGPMSALFAETIAACIEYDSPFFVGHSRNAVGALADKCRQAGVNIIEIS